MNKRKSLHCLESAERPFVTEKGHTKPRIHHIPAFIKYLDYDPELLNPTTIYEHLKARRRKLGWTQKIAANNLGVDLCTLSKWESVGAIMAIEHRELVASFLGLPKAKVYVEMKNRWNEQHE